MKKYFLFFAAFAALSLASCGGGDASSVPDGNSQNPGIDPNDGTHKESIVDPGDPAQQTPQMPFVPLWREAETVGFCTAPSLSFVV